MCVDYTNTQSMTNVCDVEERGREMGRAYCVTCVGCEKRADSCHGNQ